MRFVMIGAGAVGGVVGGRLFEHGHDVVLVARGEHLRRISADGLRIASPECTSTVRVPAVDGPAAAGVKTDDVVLLAVKSQDTTEALSAVAAGGVAPAIVCLQNGVSNERRAARLSDDVYGCCVMCPTGYLEPGVVEAWSSPTTGLLDLGRYPDGVDDRAERIAAAFRASSFDAVARPDIMAWKHQKLLMNLGNAVEALCGREGRAGDVTSMAVAEATACYAAAGIDFVSADVDRARRGDLLRIGRIDGRQRDGGSTWQSLARHAGSAETDHLNGEIVALGERWGVPTPVNAGLLRLVHRQVANQAGPGTMSVEELRRELGVGPPDDDP